MKLVSAVTILSLTAMLGFAQVGTAYKIYSAKEGELLSEIAKRFNVSVQDILRVNPEMVSDQRMRQGEVVLVPVKGQTVSQSSKHHQIKPSQQTSQSPTSSSGSFLARTYWVYTVREGDTLDSIARQFGVTVTAIANANNLVANDSLTPGQVLVIPVFEQRVENEPTKPTQTSANIPSAPSKIRTVSTRSIPILPAPRIFGYVGTVVSAVASIRSSPNKNSPVWSRVLKGTQLVITSERSGWYGVLMINGATGWVRQTDVRKESKQIFWDEIMQAFGGQEMQGGNEVVAEAVRYLGVPYRYGGTSLMRGLDCSAFVQRVFANLNIRLPRTAAEQAKVGLPVSLSNLKPGDRLYFAIKGSRIDHCGIYIGNGMFIHASGRHDAVVISNLFEPIYARSLVAIRR